MGQAPGAASMVYYYCLGEASHERIREARHRFTLSYPLLDGVFAGNMPVRCCKVFSYQVGVGTYLDRQEPHEYRGDIPNVKPGGVSLDYYQLDDRGWGVDQLVVYWDPKDSTTIKELYDAATST